MWKVTLPRAYFVSAMKYALMSKRTFLAYCNPTSCSPHVLLLPWQVRKVLNPMKVNLWSLHFDLENISSHQLYILGKLSTTRAFFQEGQMHVHTSSHWVFGRCSYRFDCFCCYCCWFFFGSIPFLFSTKMCFVVGVETSPISILYLLTRGPEILSLYTLQFSSNHHAFVDLSQVRTL